MGFWEREKEEVKRQNTTQAWIATRIGKSPNTVRGWISKGVLPDVEAGVEIAKALDTTVEYLVSGSDSSDPWFSANRDLLADLKTFTPDELAFFARQAKAIADDHRRESGKSSHSTQAG